jgi:hypothetical protein
VPSGTRSNGCTNRWSRATDRSSRPAAAPDEATVGLAEPDDLSRRVAWHSTSATPHPQ